MCVSKQRPLFLERLFLLCVFWEILDRGRARSARTRAKRANEREARGRAREARGRAREARGRAVTCINQSNLDPSTYPKLDSFQFSP